MSAWQNGVFRFDRHLAEQLSEPKDPYAILAGLSVLTPKYVVFNSITEYTQDPEAALQPLIADGITSLYVAARTSTPGQTNVRTEEPIGAESIADFLLEHVGAEN